MANFKLILVKEDGNETGVAEGDGAAIKAKIDEIESENPDAQTGEAAQA